MKKAARRPPSLLASLLSGWRGLASFSLARAADLADLHKVVPAVLRSHRLPALGADPLIEFRAVPFLDGRAASRAGLAGALRVCGEAAPLIVVVTPPMGGRDAHRAF